MDIKLVVIFLIGFLAVAIVASNKMSVHRPFNETIMGLSFLKTILVLSIKRKGQWLISPVYSQVLFRDTCTLVGTKHSSEALKFKFDTL